MLVELLKDARSLMVSLGEVTLQRAVWLSVCESCAGPAYLKRIRVSRNGLCVTVSKSPRVQVRATGSVHGSQGRTSAPFPASVLFSGDGGSYRSDAALLPGALLEVARAQWKMCTTCCYAAVLSLMREKTTRIGTPAHKIQITDREQILPLCTTKSASVPFGQAAAPGEPRSPPEFRAHRRVFAAISDYAAARGHGR